MKSMSIKIQLCLFLVMIFSHYTFTNAQNAQCRMSLGCLLRAKYFVHVPYQGQDGSALPLKTSFNYKIVYLYLDRMIIYTSSKTSENGIELEQDMTKAVDEFNVERIINFSEIILDCGKFHNKLCFAQSYPEIQDIPIFKEIKKIIPTNPDVKCIVVPFYENSYKLKRDKVAFICIQDIRQLAELIEFKNSLSRWVERYQMKLSDDRFNPWNGLLRAQAQMIYFFENKPKPVLARLYGKRIILVTNDKATAFIKDFSLYQARKKSAYFVEDALKLGKISAGWNKDFEWPTTPDCCLVFPGGNFINNFIF
jgi:hypothetical protein